MNVQIKKFILPSLRYTSASKHDLENSGEVRKLTTSLNMHDLTLYDSDFIAKFVSLNKEPLESIVFKKIKFTNGINDLSSYL